MRDELSSRPLRVVGDHETARLSGQLADEARRHGAKVCAVDAFGQDEVADGCTQAWAAAAQAGQDVWIPFVGDVGGLTRASAIAVVANIVGVTVRVGPALQTPAEVAITSGHWELVALLERIGEQLRAALSTAAAPALLRAVGKEVRALGDTGTDSQMNDVVPQRVWDDIMVAAIDAGVRFEALPVLLGAVAGAIPGCGSPPGAAATYHALDRLTRPANRRSVATAA